MHFSFAPEFVEVFYGKSINVIVALDGTLQGQGCFGDDGWWTITQMPAGITSTPVPEGYRISGTYLEQQQFGASISAMGTSEDCADQVELWRGAFLFAYVGQSLPTIVPAALTFKVGEDVSQYMELTDPLFLQGLGYEQDGHLNISTSIPGLSCLWPYLTGVPTRAGSYLLVAEITGSTQEGGTQVYQQCRVPVTVLQRESLALPCGPVSGVVARLRVYETARLPRPLPSGLAGEVCQTSLADQADVNGTPFALELAFPRCAFASAGKDGQGGAYQYVEIEAELSRPRPDLTRWLAQVRNRDLGAEIVDSHGQVYCIGDADFPLQLSASSTLDGKANAVKIVLSGNVPFVRLVRQG